MRHSHSEKI